MADRFRGISLFSWAPAEETSTHTSARDKALAYEDTEAMHSPGERQAMAKLGGLMPALIKCKEYHAQMSIDNKERE